MRVELRDIRKRYGRLDAVAGVDLDLASGSRVALIGPNGSGKTTLIRAIMGLIGHAGEVRIDGRPAPEARIAEAGRLAYVPQIAPQMAAPVGDLIRTVANVRGIDASEVVALARELDLDVGAVAKRAFRDLSGGMKHKLLISIALAARPRLIVLDEPTASLDPAARARFAALQAERLEGATVILCSHRLDELRTLVDRVVALADGRVVHDADSAAFVHAHTTSVIEVRLRGDPAALIDRGFTAGAGGWWTRTVDAGAKLPLVPDLVAELASRLEDIVVRDLDRLVVEEPR